MILIDRKGIKIDGELIKEMESYAGLIFPTDYINFLLDFNGGKPIPDTFSFVENGKSTESDVNWFFTINSENTYDLKKHIDVFKIDAKRIPNHFIPIGVDSGGNLICISCGQFDYGQVFFWDHEGEVDYTKSPDSDYSNIYHIANNFTEFLNGLHELD